MDLQSGCSLGPGYYLLKAEPRRLPAGVAVFFESGGTPYGCTRIPLAHGGVMLGRFRAPVKIGIQRELSPAGGPWALKYLKLLRPAAALIKAFMRRRSKHRIRMPTGRGYVCVLSGIAGRDKLPALSRNAMLQRSLWHLGLDDQSISSPDLFDNPLQWLPTPETPSFPPPNGKIAAVLHLYYTDLWPELAAFLCQIPYPFDLWITHCGMDAGVRAQILELFPQSQIVQVENRGRDVWPFISLLNAGALEKYDYICKIHSKKSAHKPGQEESLLGRRWRRRVLYDLLAAGRARQIVDMFECDPSLGIVGPAALRMPNARYTADMAWGTDKNRELTMRLARRTGMEMGAADLDFFAGSMFWVRPRALEPIRRLNLQRSDFPDEAGQLDGELQHAFERLFSVSAMRRGLSISDVTPLDIPRMNTSRLGSQAPT